MSDGAAQKKGTPLWVKIGFGLSLALNLMIVGLVAGFILRGGPPSGGPVGASYAAPYVKALSREDRRKIFRAVRRDGAERPVSSRRERRARYDEMVVAIRAEPFVPGGVQAILETQRTEGLTVQSRMQAAWLEHLHQMTSADRQAYADRLEETLARNGRGKPRKE
ncbi:MAG: periplasmic heavy metal sensor [Paracoccaceae bacterium]